MISEVKSGSKHRRSTTSPRPQSHHAPQPEPPCQVGTIVSEEYVEDGTQLTVFVPTSLANRLRKAALSPSLSHSFSLPAARAAVAAPARAAE